MPVFVDHRLGSVHATATAAANRQMHLQLAHRVRTLIDGAADLAIGNPVAYADVHGDLLTCRRAADVDQTTG